MRQSIFLIAIALSLAGNLWPEMAEARKSGGSVSVKGYFRKDGTYVVPHFRSAPDGNFYNNWSTHGNINPYTGEEGKLNSPSIGTIYTPSITPYVPIYTADSVTAPTLPPASILPSAIPVNSTDKQQQNGDSSNTFAGSWTPQTPSWENHANLPQQAVHNSDSGKMTFIPDVGEGSRIDYMEDKTFNKTQDSIKGKTEFIMHNDDLGVTIRIIGNKKETEEIAGVVLQQTAEMVVIATIYGAQKGLDKIDVYTLFPALGVGFLNITHAYGGIGELGKALVEAGKGYPSASSITIPLKLE